MDFKGKIKDVSKDWISNRWKLTFELDDSTVAGLDKLIDKLLTITIKQHRNRRSLDANAYAWVLMQKIAEAVNSDKDSVYLKLLARYGVFTHIIVKQNVVDRVIAEWRTVVNLGEVTVNGQTGIQLQCYFGSSTYDTKEMAAFIDGLIQECRELDIETATPDEIARMKREWGVEFAKAV